MQKPSRNERVLGPLKVGLRRDLHFTRQDTRGGPRYVVHDPVTFQNHAFSIADYQVLTAILHRRTLADTFEHLVHEGLLEDNAIDREGFYKFVLWLHGQGLLHLPISNGDALYERSQRRASQRRRSWYTALLNHRIPLGNPDGLLQRTLPWVGWLFSGPGLLLWLGLMGIVAWKCVDRLDELFADATTLLSFANLPLLWLAMVCLKAIHEFGHAYACRRFGGPVPEMGVVLIVLTPCAYVDASASWRLPGRRQRAVVALAGMYVESIVAALAALVWVGTPPGLLHDFAFNVVALASVVTVLFNINPLMRYDGYYLFSDLVGVFNLQQRATSYFGAWVARIALGTPRPADTYTAGERLLYGLYGPATFVYRGTLAFGITALVMTRWPAAGLALAAVFGWALIALPVLRLLRRLWQLDAAGQRTRARLVAIAMTTILPLGVSIVPVSWHVTAPGILDPRTRESVRAPEAGFVDDLRVDNGAAVHAGDVLCVLRNPDLEARRARMAGERDAELTSLDAIELSDTTQAAVHRSRLAYLRAGVDEIDARLAAMRVVAQSDGTVTSPQPIDATGRFLQQGDELFQIQAQHRFVRVVLTDEDVSRARLEIGSRAQVCFRSDAGNPVRGTVREIRAAASREEIPLALTLLGGGDVYARPLGEGSDFAIAAEPYLHVLIEVDRIPLDGRGAGLTARVELPARVELLGYWLQRRLLSFLNSWRMT